MKPDQTETSIRIILADDHDLVRSGIKALLSMVEGVQVVAEARDGQELIQLVDSLNPDIVMTDISMPRMDGITAIAQIHARHPKVRLLVLSMYDTVDFVKRAVTNGACGYLMKDAPPFELEQAVRSVMATGSYFSPAIAQRLLQPSEPTIDDELTQHHAGRRPAFAHIVLRLANAAAATRAEVAPRPIASQVLSRRGVLGSDHRPVAFEFFRDQLRQPCQSSLAHFGAGDADHNRVVGPHNDPGIDFGRQRGLRLRFTRERDVERHDQAGRGRCRQEAAAAEAGDAGVHVVLPSVCWIASAALFVLPPCATTLMAARMRL